MWNFIFFLNPMQNLSEYSYFSRNAIDFLLFTVQKRNVQFRRFPTVPRVFGEPLFNARLERVPAVQPGDWIFTQGLPQVPQKTHLHCKGLFWGRIINITVFLFNFNELIFQARSPCDAQNQTQTIYKWLDPKICVSGLRLPPPGPKHPCLPCNPGMSQAAGGAACEFCPLNHISEAGGDCKKCPPNTTPNYGYIMERWAEMPPMVSSACRQQDGEHWSRISR